MSNVSEEKVIFIKLGFKQAMMHSTESLLSFEKHFHNPGLFFPLAAHIGEGRNRSLGIQSVCPELLPLALVSLSRKKGTR